MADIFAVIADHTRRDLLTILLRPDPSEGREAGEFSVSELVAELALSQPTVSKHLKVLREARLVSVREKGQHRYYRLEPSPLTAVAEWTAPFVRVPGRADETPDADHDRPTGEDSERTGPVSARAHDSLASRVDPGSSALAAAAMRVGRLAADIRFSLRGSV